MKCSRCCETEPDFPAVIQLLINTLLLAVKSLFSGRFPISGALKVLVLGPYAEKPGRCQTGCWDSPRSLLSQQSEAGCEISLGELTELHAATGS